MRVTFDRSVGGATAPANSTAGVDADVAYAGMDTELVCGDSDMQPTVDSGGACNVAAAAATAAATAAAPAAAGVPAAVSSSAKKAASNRR